MNRILIPVLAALLLASACDQDTELSIAPDISSFSFDSDGGEFDVVIFTNGIWTATCDDEAVTCTPASGDYTTPMHVEVGPNPERFTKAIRISLSSELDDVSRTSKIVVTQTCAPFIFCEEEYIAMPASGGTARFHVNSNDDWSLRDVTCNGEPDYLQVDPTNHAENSVEVAVRVPENTSGEKLEWEVTLALVSYPDVQVVLRIPQDA